MTKPLSLLIVDDNAGIRAVIRAILSGVAGVVDECADGAAGVAAYERSRPDWVVMDISMPVLDGIGATRRICARDPRAQIVIVTDYDDLELQRAARLAGAVGYVTKDDLSRLPQLLSTIASP